MNLSRVRFSFAAVVLAAGLTVSLSPAGFGQGVAEITKDPKTGNISLKALTSQDLKVAITQAVTTGDIDAKDGKALIEKITDIETLMDQFDFIRDQQRRLIGSYGSVIH